MNYFYALAGFLAAGLLVFGCSAVSKHKNKKLREMNTELFNNVSVEILRTHYNTFKKLEDKNESN